MKKRILFLKKLLKDVATNCALIIIVGWLLENTTKISGA
jgi:hypothetical protein